MKPFFDADDKVRDDCHYTGEYRGAAHSSCNLKYKIPGYIPIVFYNLGGYDAHLFIRKLGKNFNRSDIGCIAEKKEKYISFNVRIKVKLAGVFDEDGCDVYKNIKLRFIDSFRFQSKSLDELSKTLKC